MNTHERLKEARVALGLKQKDFASRLGLKQASYSMIENGKCTLRESVVKSVCTTFAINEDWLKTGVGEMFVDKSRYEAFLRVYNELTPANKELIDNIMQSMLDKQDEQEAEVQAHAERIILA